MVRKIAIWTVSIVGVFIVMFPIILVGISRLQVASKSIEDIEQYIGFSLPISASDVEYGFSAVRDTSARIRFTVPVDEISSTEQLLETHCVEVADEGFMSLAHIPNDDWWITEELSGESTFTCFDQNGRVYSYLVVPKNDINFVFYLYVG